MVDEYLSVSASAETLTVIERSKFISYIKSVNSEEEAKEFVAEIRKKNSLATHNCYAYIADDAGNIQKCSDDGEPQGTAGIPMLQALKDKNLKKVCAVVTRYFGGIKLGTGGLSRAYSGAVLSAIEEAGIKKYSRGLKLEIVLSYEQYSTFNKIVLRRGLACETEFNDACRVTFYAKVKDYDEITAEIEEAFSGSLKAVIIGEGYVG